MAQEIREADKRAYEILGQVPPKRKRFPPSLVTRCLSCGIHIRLCTQGCAECYKRHSMFARNGDKQAYNAKYYKQHIAADPDKVAKRREYQREYNRKKRAREKRLLDEHRAANIRGMADSDSA